MNSYPNSSICGSRCIALQKIVEQSWGKKPYWAKMGVGFVGSPSEIVRGEPGGTSRSAATWKFPARSTAISQLGSDEWFSMSAIGPTSFARSGRHTSWNRVSATLYAHFTTRSSPIVSGGSGT